MNNTPLHSKRPGAARLIAIGAGSALLVAVLGVSAQAWFGYAEQAESAEKARAYRDRENAALIELRRGQQEHLSSYRWTDEPNRRAAIPIEVAMRLVAAEGGKVKFPSTAPAGSGSATAAVATVSPGAGETAPLPPGLSADAVAAGRKFYQSLGCMACHPIDGTSTINGLPAQGPSLKDVYGSTVQLEGGQSVLADEAYVRESVKLPQAKIVKGFPAVQMPNFSPLIKDQDLDNFIQFLKANSKHYKPDGEKKQ